MSRADIAEALSRLLASRFIIVGERETLLQALDRFALSKLGFADCYLAAAASIGDSEIATFDADLRKLKNVRSVDPLEL